MVELICEEFKTDDKLVEEILNVIYEEEKTDQENCFKEEQRMKLDDEIRFLKEKIEELKLLKNEDKENKRKDLNRAMENENLDIIKNKRELLNLKKEIKEEEIRIVEKEKELDSFITQVSFSMKNQLSQNLVNFNKNEI